MTKTNHYLKVLALATLLVLAMIAASGSPGEAKKKGSGGSGVRVASFTGISSLSGGNNGTVATTTIHTPASGFLVIDAGSNSWNYEQDDVAECFIEVDNTFAPGSDRYIEHNGASNVNQEEDCSTNTVVPVAAGTHTVDLEARSAAAGTNYRDTALSAIYVPFDGAGASPSSAAITAAQ